MSLSPTATEVRVGVEAVLHANCVHVVWYSVYKILSVACTSFRKGKNKIQIARICTTHTLTLNKGLFRFFQYNNGRGKRTSVAFRGVVPVSLSVALQQVATACDPHQPQRRHEETFRAHHCISVDCSAGFIRVGFIPGTNPGTCEPCPPGSYKTPEQTNDTFCVPCVGPGDLTDYTTVNVGGVVVAGATNISQCTGEY